MGIQMKQKELSLIMTFRDDFKLTFGLGRHFSALYQLKQVASQQIHVNPVVYCYKAGQRHIRWPNTRRPLIQWLESLGWRPYRVHHSLV